MGTLLFDSLEIHGFRAFQHLRIEKLGRVNLIVGKNNVGKSCLLEALQLYAERAHPAFLWHLLEIHDEYARSPKSALTTFDDDVSERLSIVKNLFYGRPEITGLVPPIEIGPIDSSEKTLRLSVGFYTSKVNEKGQITFKLLSADEYDSVDHTLPGFSVQLGESREVFYPLETTPTSNGFGQSLKSLFLLQSRTR